MFIRKLLLWIRIQEAILYYTVETHVTIERFTRIKNKRLLSVFWAKKMALN